MANTFKSSGVAAVGTAAVSVYTAPANTISTLIGCSLANVNTVTVYVTAKLFKGVNGFHLVKDAPIPVGGTLVLVGGDQKIVMEPGDFVQITGSVANAVDVVSSALEVS